MSATQPSPPVNTSPARDRRPDPGLLKQVMGSFCTGIAVITAPGCDSDPRPAGMAVQTFASLSLDPPLICFAPARSSSSWPRIRDAGRFAVSILAEDQRELSARFAASGTDKFAGVRWRPGGNGAPVLEGALAGVECDLETELPGGDHTIAIGRVTALPGPREAGPLLYFRRNYGALGPAPAAPEASGPGEGRGASAKSASSARSASISSASLRSAS